MASAGDITDLKTPPSCTADFCLIPLGTPTASVSKEVAEVQRLLKKSGLNYSMHSAGTTVEGSWDDVMRVIGQCHAMLHQNGIVRIQSDIRVGSRTDKKQGFKDKVEAVERLLKEDGN
ncbi:Nn.00g003190.m01.CDS01 [Neocucurbitaria sp. VM-36]